MTSRILAIDDDPIIPNLLREKLEKEGFSVFTAKTGKAGLELAKKEQPDAIILNSSMPDRDGFEVCKALKESQETRFIPILILSGKGHVDDRIAGLELGADEYIAKPFDFNELLTRLRVMMRRHQSLQETSTKCGALHVDWARYRVTLEGKEIGLRPKEFELLRALIKAKGRVLTRGQIFHQVWDYKEPASLQTRTLDQHISHLRKKLQHEGIRIRSVKDVGYSFEIEDRSAS